MFKLVKRDTTLSERTEQQLEELILNRSLRAGDRLPSQEELGRLLGVSRTVIREAVQLLTAKGLLEGRKGSGIYVRALGIELVQRPVNMLARSHVINQSKIMEARDLLEQTDRSITEIAFEVGYSSSQTFARVFLRNQHVTPTDYRRATRDPTASVAGWRGDAMAEQPGA